MGLKEYLDKTLFKLTDEEVAMEKYPERFKECEECGGFGFLDAFINCDTCDKTGSVRKSYQEYIDSLPVETKT